MLKTLTRLKPSRCLIQDRLKAEQEIKRQHQHLAILKEEPAPLAKGRYHFHCSRFWLSDKKTIIDVFHIKPIYYHTKTGRTRPLEEICAWHGNRKIILRDSPFNLNLSLDYLLWLIKRQALLGWPLFWNCYGRLLPVLLGTVSTFYPDPDTETTSVDGKAREAQAGGVSWAALEGGVGTSAADSTATDYFALIESYTSPNWQTLDRSILLYDTSAIPDADPINSATLSVWGTVKTDGCSITPTFNVYSSAPASNTAVVAGDFDSLGATAYSDTSITLANYSTTGYNDWAFNAAGLAAINKTGVSKFGIREATYDAGASTPTHPGSSGALSYIFGRYSEYTGTDNDPKLVVTHAVVVSVRSRGYIF